MGQPIVVREKPSSHPGVVRFETNRALTGMGHERYRNTGEVWGERPPDELARRLFGRGGVAGVHINGNVVTVDLEKGFDAEGLREIVENLYIHYPPGSEEADDADPVAAGSESSEVAEATAAAAPLDDEGNQAPEAATGDATGADPAGPVVTEPGPTPPAAEAPASAEPEPGVEGEGSVEPPAQDSAEAHESTDPVSTEPAADGSVAAAETVAGAAEPPVGSDDTPSGGMPDEPTDS